MLKQARLFAVAAIAVLLSRLQRRGASPPAFSTTLKPQAEDRELTTVSTFVAQDNATGELVRIYPTRDTIDALRATEAGQRELQARRRLTYHGGPVQTAPKIYVVFWGSAWNSSGDPNGVAARLKAF